MSKRTLTKAARRRRNRARERSFLAVFLPRLNAGKLSKAEQRIFKEKLL